MAVVKQQLIDARYQPLVDGIECYFAQSNVVLQDDRNTIKEVVFERETLVVKSYKKLGWLRGVIYTYLEKSKACRAYEYGLRIAEFTPEVIARIEYFQPLIGKSYFICRKFEADFDIRRPLLEVGFSDRVPIFQQFAAFVYQLHQNHIFHQDLSPGNVLIEKNQQGYVFKIIDINRMCFKTLNIQQCAKNFNKLWADDTDLSVMLKAYAKLAQFDEVSFVQLGVKYNQQNKARKIRKRNIKRVLGL
ncbi:MAG: hypothetical protein FE834_04130 [Gammaproteobacteria bacterium]|nr:hypothetical protein [Gammaproteobacteria bacterium]